MKFIDLTGQRFGKLVAKEIDHKQKDRIYWKCICDCGNDCIADGAKLRNGKKTHCGCVKHTPSNFKDLTGQRFGTLIVIKRVDDLLHSNRKKVKWLCQCDCGNETIVESSNLTSGHTKGCGCKRNQNTSERCLIDLTGMQFGQLTVLSRAENYISPNGFQNTQWNCKCSCGNVKIISQSNLRNGQAKSCGCLRSRISSERSFENLTGQKFGMLTVVRRSDNLIHPNGSFSVQWECLCECGNHVVVNSGNLKNGHTISCGCIASKNEKIIGNILEKGNCKYNKQVSFKDCIDVAPLRFDFGIYDNEKLLGLIEYDGEQHYMPIRFGPYSEKTSILNFENTKRRDKIKDEYCKSNNIKLLRIPYWEKCNIETIVINYINELKEAA